ncbi:hypothetical protein DS745_14495 [Anaerobacillus alkaliphilus]|uniref:LysM domain-containing protein n=1 Tax=Anaerobacillus alkaliphilus TaxID=1548597 RepID=A0A4Q0VRM9_9BACI|nr:hypothetical protein [Anaerobacillus alkaliphilus]RXI99435.1 hypothetical protein DS745_14495 [Anaerobacillus alkaliphilus]
MKKLLIPVLLLISIYSIYFDLKIGTLPTSTFAAETSPMIEVPEQTTFQIPAELIVVEPGYTVLSIVEELHGEPVNATIQQIVLDFETLNPGTNASKIQTGKAYYFPVYRK